MNRTDTRRHRRGRSETPDTAGADTVTLQSREFIEKLLREYLDNTKHANLAKDEAQRAFKDAARFEQQATDLSAKEQAVIARIQQAQAELQQLQADRKEAATFAEQARSYGNTQMGKRDGFTGQATDARTVLESFQIPIPDDTDTKEQAALPAGEGSDPTDPTRVDLSDDDPLTGPLSRFNEAHDEQDHLDAQSAGAA